MLFFLLIGSAAGAWWLWTQWQQSEQRADGWQERAAQLQVAIDGLQATAERLGRTQRALETRAADNAATNKVLREELLGMGERASLLEDAVARLADNRLRGDVVLRLNEAEFLLLLGEERLRLFGDVPAAIQAYTLVDAALAGLDDPVLATMRQTLAQELIALRNTPVDPRPAARAELAHLGAELDGLPASRDDVVQTTGNTDSRLVRLLSQLVTVRRVSERDNVLGPVQREATLAALRLQLELAQAALARPDPAAFEHSMDRARALVGQIFDAGDARVAQIEERLAALRATPLMPQPPVLGATLQELRGLRAARSIGGLERAMPQGVALPPDATDATDAADAATPGDLPEAQNDAPARSSDPAADPAAEAAPQDDIPTDAPVAPGDGA